MSEISETVRVLEASIGKLFQRLESAERTAGELRRELEAATATIDRQNAEADALKKQYETLKIAHSLLGSDENKRDTKLKINALIREIDYCIAQLSD